MLKIKAKIGDVVIVNWFDNCGFKGNSWKNRAEVCELNPLRLCTTGIIVELNKEYLILSNSWATDDTTNFGGSNLILCGCVENITVVQRSKKNHVLSKS